MAEIVKEGKSAVAAVVLSILWPGFGQLCAGSIGKGFAFLFMALFGWLLIITLFGANIGIPLLAVVYIWASVDAYKAAKA